MRPRKSVALVVTLAIAAAVILVLGGPMFGQYSTSLLAASSDSSSAPKQILHSMTPGVPTVSLTEQERTWLREHPVIRVAQDPGWAPVEFADEQGNPSGISADYLQLVEQRLGVTFQQVRNLSWQESFSRLKRWEIDMTTCVTVTPERIKFWAFTKPYLEIPIVILAQRDVTYISGMHELTGKKLAVVDGYALVEWLSRDFPGIRLVKVKNVADGLLLLQKGEVFGFVDNLLVTSYYLTKLKAVDLKVAGTTPYVNAQSMAVRKDWAIFAGILQKALDSISPSERDAIYAKWVPVRYEYGFNYRLFWRFLALFVVILAGLIIWNRRLSREIRQRKAAEAALQRNEALLRQTQEVTRVGGWEYDVTSDHLVWTEEIYRIFEVPRDYNPNGAQKAAEFFLAEDRARITEAFNRAVEQGEPYDLELQVITAKGRNLWVRTVGKTEQKENKVVRVFGNILDITERKRSAEELADSNKLLQIIINTAPVRVFWKDTKLRYLGCNLAFAQDAGMANPAELIGKDDYQLWRKELAEQYRADDRLVIDSGVPKLSYDEMQNKPGGGYVWVRTSKVPLCNEQYEIIGMLGIYEDITERKLLEAQLIQAQKMEAIGQLAGGVAHDFNNKLGVILGYAELALRHLEQDQPLFNQLQEIRKAADSSADLTRQLLAFARKQTVTPLVLDLNENIEGMLKMLRRLIGEDIELVWLPGMALWPVKVDPAQIDQLLANLSVNARDAINGVGRLIIETEKVTLDAEYCATHAGCVPGDYVLLVVSDNGCGMDQTTQDRIFEPFFTTKEVGKGTGLGLATVFGIVKQNQGFINVYSEPGQGTSFKIYLPRHRGDGGQLRTEDPVLENQGGHERILLVEDDPSIRSIVKIMLETLGYLVMEAGSPREAIQVTEQHVGEIDLLLTDVIMPEINGKDLANLLQPLCPGLKCLFMSGYTANVIAHHGVLDEGVLFVQKPFSLKDLDGKVRAALDTP
ncbi:MAG: transporter substrate-binding domain-containing protein [Geobacteraceae bacterium]|nr:transporter substrate-binding domain-containing protein [Geobacteraceae bacterium]